MNKNLPIYLYGTIMILEGIFLLFSSHFSFETVKYTLGMAMIIGALFGFLKALLQQKKRIEFAYHEIHGLTILLYGVSVLLFATNLETLTQLSAFVFIFYTFSEIIFCFFLFDLAEKLVSKIVLVRIFLGILVGIGTIIIMHYFSTNDIVAMQGYAILFIIIGINTLLYVPIIKTRKLKRTA